IEEYFDKELKVKPGDRLVINKQQYEHIESMLGHRELREERGGTTAITLETLGRLGKGETRHNLIGVMGPEDHDKIIEGAFRNSGVKIHQINGSLKGESAVSFVMRYPDGPPSIVTYPGNAKQKVTTHQVPWDKIDAADIIYLQGSMRERFDPSVMDELIKRRWE